MDSTAQGQELAFCTLATPDVVNQVLVLIDSVQQHHPVANIFVLLVVDSAHPVVPPVGYNTQRVHWLILDDLNIPSWKRLAFKYNLYELCCALKPFLIQHVRRVLKDRVLVFLDADICLYSPLPISEFAASSNAMMLTSHFIYGANLISEESVEWERKQLPYGVFNGGFLALRPCEQADRFLAWWGDRVSRYGSLAVLAGLFLDQKWLNFVTCYFDVCVLKHPGCNVAWWNFHERTLRVDDGDYKVGDEKLIFFHFSGMSWTAPIKASQHKPEPLSPGTSLYSLMSEYRDRCMAKQLTCSGFKLLPSPFQRFSNGTRIPSAVRLLAVWGSPSLPRVEDPFDLSLYGPRRSWYLFQYRLFNLIESCLAWLPESLISAVTYRFAWLLTLISTIRRLRKV